MDAYNREKNANSPHSDGIYRQLDVVHRWDDCSHLRKRRVVRVVGKDLLRFMIAEHATVSWVMIFWVIHWRFLNRGVWISNRRRKGGLGPIRYYSI